MKRHSFETKEALPRVVVASSATESLMNVDVEQSESVWPEKICNNPELKAQVEVRRELASNITSLFSVIPKATMPITEALQKNIITEAAAAETYHALSDFLIEDAANARILLYLPFEIIPESAYKPESEELDNEIKNFLQIYMGRWNQLLSQQDLRANFSNGDIPESDFYEAPLPKICKAAHMLPVLVQKGLINIDEVVQMIEGSDDEVLRGSIADTLPVLSDMNLLSESQIEAMANSPDPILRNMSIIIKDNMKHARHGHDTDTAEFVRNHSNSDEQSFLAMLKSLHEGFSALEKPNSNEADKLPKKRSTWIKKEKQKDLIDDYSTELSSMILAGSLEAEAINKILSDSLNGPAEISDILMGIEGIRKAVETAATTNFEQAKDIIEKYKSVFMNIWEEGPLEAKKTLEKAWSRWSVIGVIEKEYIKQFGIKTPEFDAPFTVVKEGLSEEMGKLTDIVKKIESDAELSKSLYPALILFGSKVKGYGTLGSDIDIAAFIKPDVQIGEREQIQNKLNALFTDQQMDGGAVEFWLENMPTHTATEDGKDGSILMVRDFPNDGDKLLGSFSYVHVLFEGLWCGEDDTVKELHQKLLANYLFIDDNVTMRNAFLREMERDCLQYRLMHRGYLQFYPEQGGMKTQHSESIDSNNAFWDSGYRRTATKLFLEKVFLPNLAHNRLEDKK